MLMELHVISNLPSPPDYENVVIGMRFYVCPRIQCLFTTDPSEQHRSKNWGPSYESQKQSGIY
jgi:hypothetical protein